MFLFSCCSGFSTADSLATKLTLFTYFFCAFLKTHSQMGNGLEIRILPHLFHDFVTAVFLQNCPEYRYFTMHHLAPGFSK